MINLESRPAVVPRNLIKIPWVGAFLKSRWYPGVFQWPVMLVFAVIIYQLMLGPKSAHANFGTAMTWVLWWPLLPIILFFAGRVWCAVCPFAKVNDLVQQFVGNKKPVPKFLKKYGIWIIDALFILITWGDHVWGVVENPLGSGLLLLTITTAVVFSGAFYEKRAFCRYVCFLGGLSGNYARAGIVQLRGTPDICKTCTSASCYIGTENVAPCPMSEFPKTMTSSANCVLCANCIKSCPNDSIQLTLRPPTKELWFIRKPKIEEAFLAAVIMGIVFVQNVTMLEIWGTTLKRLEGITGTTSYFVNFSITFALAIALPVGLLALASWVAGKANRESFVTNFTRFGYSIIALDIAGHVAHNLFHLLAEGKSVIYTGMTAFGKPAGHASAALLDSGTIQVLQYILIFLGLAASLYTVYRIALAQYPAPKRLTTALPYVVMIAVFAIINVWLFALPMGMRM